MKRSLLRILNIKPLETEKVKYLFLIQFFSGVAMAFLYTAGSTIFLHGMDIKEMATVYLVSGFLLIVFNNIYTYLEHHYSLKKTYSFILIFSLITVFVFKFFISDHSHGFIVLALLVWYHILYFLCGSGFWGIASIIFNVRESKRVFSIIGSGDIPAKLLGYLSVSILVPYIGIENLLSVAAFSFALAFFFFYRFLKKFNIDEEHDHHEAIHTDQNIQKNVTTFFGNNLIMFIGITTVFFAASTVLIDYVFLSEVKHKYYENEELASFLSKFFAYSRILAVIVKIFLSGKIQQSLGIKSTLMVLPLVIILFSWGVFICTTNEQNHYILYAFGILMVLNEVIKSSIYEPMFFTLFQPLKPSQRLRGHNITKGVMGPIGYILMASFLIFYVRSIGVLDMSHICIILFVLSLMWIAVIFLIEKSYYDTMRKAIKHNSFFNLISNTFIKEGATLKLIEDKLESKNSIEVRTALQYIYDIDINQFKKEIKKKINRETNEHILEFIIEKINLHKWTDFNEELADVFGQFENEHINKMIAITLCELDADKYSEYLLMSGGNEVVKNGCISGALRSENLNAIIDAGQSLIEKLNSSNTNQRKIALEIIEETENPILFKQIQLLLYDQDPEIKKQILKSIVKIKNPSFVAYIIEQLSDKELQFAAEQCMIHYSDVWAKDIDLMSEKIPREKLIEYIVKSQSTDVMNIVLDLFAKEAHPLMCEYLYKKKHKFEDDAQILDLINKQVAALNKLKNLIESTKDAALKSALKDEYYNKVLFALQLLFLMRDTSKVYDVYQSIRMRLVDKYDQAIELLEYNTKKLSIEGLVNLVELYCDDFKNSFETDKTAEVCNEIILQEKLYSDWTIALALYTSKLVPRNALKNNSKIVREIVELNQKAK